MRVLVCGGRCYDDAIRLGAVLDDYHRCCPITLLIHGDAKGADRLAGAWASKNQINMEVYPAKWNKHGLSAGPKRNQEMLDKGKPELVIAFPGGSGTANMVKLAREDGRVVVEIE